MLVSGRAGSSLLPGGERGLLFTAVRGLLIAVAYLVVEHVLWGTQALVAVAPRLYSRGPEVVAHKSSCSGALRVFLDKGLNLCLLHWQSDSLPLSHQGNPILICFKNIFPPSKKKYIYIFHIRRCYLC